jgi:hypothetical protein
MDCPRCGEPLESYRLDDSETVVCGNCTYLGIPVDHKREGQVRESWDDAIDRFQEQQQTVKKVTEIGDTDVFSEVSDAGESDDDPSDHDPTVTDAGVQAEPDDSAAGTDDVEPATEEDDPAGTEEDEHEAGDHDDDPVADEPDDHESDGPAAESGREPASADAGD